MPPSIASAPRGRAQTPVPRARSASLRVAAFALALLAGAASAQVSQSPALGATGARQRLPAPLPRTEASVAYEAWRAASAVHREGDRPRALRMTEEALRTSPRDAQLRFLRAVLLAEMGRRTDAIEAFETLVADFPELPEPYNNLAVLHAGAGDLERARNALEEAIRALPDYGLAHENLGDVYLRMAQRAYELALRVEPTRRSAQDKLVMARELVQRVGTPRNGGAAAATRSPSSTGAAAGATMAPDAAMSAPSPTPGTAPAPAR